MRIETGFEIPIDSVAPETNVYRLPAAVMNKRADTIRILLIDSDKKDYNVTKRMLQGLPGNPILHWEKSFRSGITQLKQGVYDICLTEYQLGSHSALDVLQTAKQNNTLTPIIILTEQADHATDLLAMESGAADYLVKGDVTASLLERSIRYALERKKTERERDKLLREQTKRIEAEAVTQQVLLLSEASKILASSLDYRESIRQVARLLVPNMADWCIIDVLEKEKFERVVVLHKDPKRRRFVHSLHYDYPPDPDSPGGVGKVLRTGQAEIIPVMNEQIALETARNNPKLLKLSFQLGIKSYMAIPILIRGQVFGCVTLVYGDSGRTFSLLDLSLIREFSDRIALAIDNALLYEKSQEGIKVRDEFLNIASHELKTPLTSLQLQIQLLSRLMHKRRTPQEETKIHELAHANNKQVRNLAKLINNLLDVSRINSRQLILEKESMDLGKLLSEIVSRFRDEAAVSGIKIRYKDGVVAEGNWDRLRLDQVLTNLIGNAFKYGEGKPISVSLTRLKNNARVTIKDKGIGISESEIGRVFSRFARTDAAKRYGGLGLGLYIVKQIVEAHGGKITVKSKPGTGSSFILTLPLKRDR